MKPTEYVLEARSLRFSYPAYGNAPAELFSELSFGLRRGEFMVLLGPPEAGKTTLSRILTGLVPRYTGGEISGAVRCMGRDVADMEPHELLSRAGLVFQDPHEQLISSRCDTEIAFPLESLALEPKEIEERIDAALSFFELSSYRESDTASLSGGEKKKLLLAVQYAMDPQIWILDETIEELDGPGRSKLLDYLRRSGKSVLLFSAKLEESYRHLGATFGLLGNGSLEFGSMEEGGALYERAREEGLIPGILPSSAEKAPPEHGRARTVPAAAPARRRPANGERLITMRNLRFSYPGGAFTLDIGNLDIRRGEVMALAGPNGCGKSTLGQLLCGLREPESGTIALCSGNDEQPLPAEARTRRIAYMFQNPDYQIFLPTVEDELAFGPEQARLKREEISRLTADAIERFGLPASDTPPTLLSYGTRKRLQAATYYLLDRDLYILDEADSGITYANIVSVIDNLQHSGAALLLITHDAFLASNLCDRVARMERGRVNEVIDSADFRRQSGGGKTSGGETGREGEPE